MDIVIDTELKALKEIVVQNVDIKKSMKKIVRLLEANL